MNGLVKAVIAGSVIIVLGVLIIVVTLALNGWTVNVDWETKTFENEQAVKSLTIDYSMGDINCKFYDGEKIKIEYPDCERYKTEINEQNGVLSITSAKRRWYDFGMWWSDVPAATVYMPNGTVLDLDLIFNAGTLNVESGTYGNIKCKVNAGAVKFGNIICQSFDNTINAGVVKFDNLNCDTFRNKINAGSVNADSVVCNKFESEMNAGDAYFHKIDSADIFAKLNAGYTELTVVGTKEEFAISVEKNAGSCNIFDKADGIKKLTAKINAGSLNVEFTGI